VKIFNCSRVLKNVMSAGKTRQNSAEKRSLWLINEHVESTFSAVWPSAIVFQHPVRHPAALVLTILFCLVLSPLLTTHGEADTETPLAQAADPATNKVHVSADRLISNTADNNAEFIGHVIARQGETQITADSLKIFFSGESESEPASPGQSLKKLVATGNVEIKFDNRLAVARQAVYITAQRMLILTGPGAMVTSGDNTITGETITFYRADGRFTVEGGSTGRVKAIILPEESGLE
jgi:lipopolysaccharide export system protein LptA